METRTTVSIALASAALTAALIAVFLLGTSSYRSAQAGRGVFVGPPGFSFDNGDCYDRCLKNFCLGKPDPIKCKLKCEDTCDFIPIITKLLPKYEMP